MSVFKIFRIQKTSEMRLYTFIAGLPLRPEFTSQNTRREKRPEKETGKKERVIMGNTDLKKDQKNSPEKDRGKSRITEERVENKAENKVEKKTENKAENKVNNKAENKALVPLVIPAYEPDERMIKLFTEFREQGIRDVILVDDGSGEAYRELFRKAEEILQEIGGRLLTHEKNKGKGGAVRTAFAYVLEKYPEAIGVVTADCDGQHHIGDIRAVMQKLAEKPDCLIAGVRRFDGEDVPWKSAFGNRLTAKVVAYISGIRISDTQCGLRGIPRSFMKELLDVPGDGFEYDTRMLLEAAGKYPIEEVEIRTIYDSKENHQTHFRPVRDSIRIYRILGAKFIAFLFASLSSCAVDLGLFALFCRLFRSGILKMPALLSSLPYVAAATVLARILSCIYNFSVNYKVVFRSSEHVGRSAARYLALAVVQMTLSALLVTGGVQLLPALPEVLVKAVVDTCLFLFSYYIQRKYVFCGLPLRRSSSDLE